MPSPRNKSAQAQQRAAVLQQIAEKRQQQSQARDPANSEHAAIKHDTSEEEDMRDLEDFSSPENKPPNCVGLDDSPASVGIRKPGLSRLKRNEQRPAPSVDDLVARVQKLNMSNVRNSSTAQPSQAAPSTQLPGPARPQLYAHLAAAAATQLPSEDEQEEPDDISSGTTEESSEGGTGDGRDSSPAPGPAPPTRQAHLDSSSPSDLTDALVLGDRNQYVLPGSIHTKLYPHQVEGVRWLWSLYQQQRGGILGDDMGLGKTMQCAAFVAGLLTSKQACRVLIVAPKTLLMHWEKELAVCGLGRQTHPFYGDSASEREQSLRTAAGTSGGVMLTTYGMVLHNAAKLCTAPTSAMRWKRSGDDGEGTRDFRWDLIILDEGHKVKNPKMKLVQELRRIPAGITVIISGTPIQNNLSELHALFDICCEGLLEDRATFKRVYERHITAGQDRGATPREREIGAAVAAQLRRVIAPFFLRREKKDVLCGPTATTTEGTSSTTQPGSSTSGDAHGDSGAGRPATVTAAPAGLPHKNDLVVWLRMQPLQKAVYTSFLHSDAVKRALNETESPLAALTVLKKICDHPALLSEAAAEAIIAGSNKMVKKGKGHSRPSGYSDDEDDDDSSSDSSADEAAGGTSSKGGHAGGGADPLAAVLPALGADVRQQLMTELQHKEAHASCKTLFVLALLDELADKGHRTLVFSQSRVMLDILQAAVVAKGMSFCRIDGSISSAEERHAQVKRFQAAGADIPVFLLTSQVGGLGLTLTAADRVVIVDPAWNPAVDNQAVDRAYRIGQTRDVVVYRLITCGTVEEKIYRKQVFKGGLSRTGTEEGVQFRYFTRQQLRDLFVVTEEGLTSSTTQQQLHQMHAAQRQASQELQAHLKFMYTLDNLAGISDHDLLFTSKPQDGSRLSAEQEAALVSQLEEQANMQGDRQQRKPGSGGGGSGAGGWKGDSELLSGLFNSAMRLGTQQPAGSPASMQRKVVAELGQQLDNLKSTIASLAARMHDGGSKLFKRRDALVAELDAEKQKLQELEAGPATSAPTATTSPGVSSGLQQGSAASPGTSSLPQQHSVAVLSDELSAAATPSPGVGAGLHKDGPSPGSVSLSAGGTSTGVRAAAAAGYSSSPLSGLTSTPGLSQARAVTSPASVAALQLQPQGNPSPAIAATQAVSQATSTGSRGKGLNLHYGKHRAAGGAQAGAQHAQHVPAAPGHASPTASSSFVSAASDGEGGEVEVTSGPSSKAGAGARQGGQVRAVAAVKGGADRSAAQPSHVNVIDLTEDD